LFFLNADGFIDDYTIVCVLVSTGFAVRGCTDD
jgi:hypothetical protein